MEYSLTFDASHRVKGGNSHITGFLRHIARDADERRGVFYPHRNLNVDPARTHMNRTFVNDGNGGFRRAQSSDELKDYLNTRLKTLEKKPRVNSVLLRGFILQMDPKFFRNECFGWQDNALDDEKLADVHEEMFSWFEKTFPQENIVGFSIHLDEKSPQIHVAFTPITEDGRVAQKEFIRGPGHLRMLHDSFRAHMQDAGYSISDERKTAGRTIKHMTDDEYKIYMDTIRNKATEIQLEKEEIIKEQVKTLVDKELELLSREREILDREIELDNRESELYEREVTTEDERVRLDQEDIRLGKKKLEVESQGEKVAAREQKIAASEDALREQQIQLQQRLAALDEKEDNFSKKASKLSRAVSKYNEKVAVLRNQEEQVAKTLDLISKSAPKIEGIHKDLISKFKELSASEKIIHGREVEGLSKRTKDAFSEFYSNPHSGYRPDERVTEIDDDFQL